MKVENETANWTVNEAAGMNGHVGANQYLPSFYKGKLKMKQPVKQPVGMGIYGGFMFALFLHRRLK